MRMTLLCTFSVVVLLMFGGTANAHVAANPEILGDLGLHEGDIVGSTNPDDPDIFIINAWGFKRLFLSPLIFGFYGHLRYDAVHRFLSTVIDSIPTSGLFRNCEIDDPRVFAVQVTGEDVAILHWLNVAGADAVADDPDFFKRVFCINSREFSWYALGTPFTALSQVPAYVRSLPASGINETDLPLRVPTGYRITSFASALGPVRFMAVAPDGILFASMPSEAGLYGASGLSDGRVYALPDQDGNGVPDEVRTVLSGLRLPHGLAFHAGYLYVAEEGSVSRYPYLGSGLVGVRETIASLPTGGGHRSRTIVFGSNSMMYVSVGSECNACTTGDPGTAVIWEFNDDGSGGHVFARGLRNAVGLATHPETGALWATENGRDFLGDNLPPDEVNIIREGGNYGWPYCYGDRVNDPSHPTYDCASTIAPIHRTQAHSAPLGLRFIPSSFSTAWTGDVLVARHGSWNRSQPVGYDVIRLNVDGSVVTGEEQFITGWRSADGRTLGRPVDVIFGADGALYVSDDFADRIYRIVPGT